MGDEDEGIAIQITSDKTGEKIKGTINKFLEKNLDKKYSRLIVVLLVQKQNSLLMQSRGGNYNREKLPSYF
ncbi:MAG: SMEK domain-containing protein [bacterium]|nr:SMEK domain-containing protein [bacterium]